LVGTRTAWRAGGASTGWRARKDVSCCCAFQRAIVVIGVLHQTDIHSSFGCRIAAGEPCRTVIAVWCGRQREQLTVPGGVSDACRGALAGYVDLPVRRVSGLGSWVEKRPSPIRIRCDSANDLSVQIIEGRTGAT